jgi:hypothetical protein
VPVSACVDESDTFCSEEVSDFENTRENLTDFGNTIGSEDWQDDSFAWEAH